MSGLAWAGLVLAFIGLGLVALTVGLVVLALPTGVATAVYVVACLVFLTLVWVDGKGGRS